MANPDHLKVISWGDLAIQKWRDGFGMSQVLDLSGADLQGIHISGVNLRYANFSGANLTGARIFNCQAAHANFEGACLRGGSLSLSELQSANLRNADLSNASLDYCDFTAATLDGANLSSTILSLALFDRTEVRGTNFAKAQISLTKFLNLDLSQSLGLDEVTYGASTVGIDTLYASGGRIPDEFLRRCAVSKTLIQYVHSLVENPIEFFTCFISYTEADDEFSKRLYDDLQAEGVRCWRWREDAKWGGTLTKEVDETIRRYDKLVVILSEASLNSEPVIREIERAIQKEDRERKEVLFPIRLDGSVFTWKHELQADVVRKVIGDFCRWKDASHYQQAFKRLIDALRPIRL